jgi:hypothetical protein
MPDLPSFNDFVTSAALLPIEETIPRPVTTTRPMTACRRGGRRFLREADFHVEGFVGRLAVGLHEAVGDSHDQPAQDHPFEVHVVGELADAGDDHAGQLDLAHAKCPAAARRLHPSQEEAQHLPHGIEAQASRHHRVTLEMASEKPEVWLHVELGNDLALAVLAAGFGDLHDPIEHQHGRQRQLRVPRAK